MDLSTKYLGLKLKNPIVASSSPLTWELDSVLKLQDAGVAAIIMPSLFEEQIENEDKNLERFFYNQSAAGAEAQNFYPKLERYTTYYEKYTSQLELLKNKLDIPIIASLNGTSTGGWIEYAKKLEETGADALEINVYYVAGNSEETSTEVEQRYIDLLTSIKEQINIPVCMKISYQFSALIPFVKKLQKAGAQGVSLFNRFYQPDIDLDSLSVKPTLKLSNSNEILLRIRWVSMLRDQVKLSLAVTGGIHNANDAIKSLLVGADITCMCSGLLKNGEAHVSTVLDQITRWMIDKEYTSVEQLKGSLSYKKTINPAVYERANYIEILDNYSYTSGVMV